jgi:hypothetical protein
MAKSATERRLQKRSIELGKLFVSNLGAISSRLDHVVQRVDR